MTTNTEKPIAPSGFQPNLRVIPGTGGGGDVAEYIQPSRSGLDSGFYVTDRGLPWHVTLARRLDQPELMEGSGRKLTVGEALTLAQLDWEVATAPLFAQLPDGSFAPVPGKLATYRTDTGMVLGANLTSRYGIVQNRDAFAFADLILDTPGAHCESGGSLFGGRQTFLSMELPDDIQVGGDPSPYRLFLLIHNNHAGTGPLRLDVTIERALCRNTVRIAQERAQSTYSVRHTSGIQGRVQDAREALQLSHRYVEAFSQNATALVGQTLVDRQVDELLLKVFPLTEVQQLRIQKDPEKVLATSFGRARQVYRESETVAPIRGTAYGALSAVTEYLDHYRTFRSSDRGDAADVRADHLMFDSPEQTAKQTAWDLLMETTR